MEFTVQKRWVIQGGSLTTKGGPWCPHVVQAADSVFIELKTTDNKLRKFMGDGKDITDVVRELRNRAVDTEATRLCLRSCDRTTWCESLPETVTIDLPDVEYKEEVAAACTMTCIASASKLQCPAIELTAANLTYLRLAGLALTLDEYDVSMFVPGFRKRQRTPAENRVETPSKHHVKTDYRRKTLFAKWTDMDGRKRKHYEKPTDWTQAEITKTGYSIMDWLQENDSQEHGDE